MRAFSLIILSALAGLWVYFGVEVAQRDVSRPVAVPVETTDKTNASSLNNTGVMVDRSGRPGDALAYFQRAHSFRPDDAVILANYQRQQARVVRRGWMRALSIGTLATVVLIIVVTVWRVTRRVMDRVRLARLRVRGERAIRIGPESKKAELNMRFSRPVRCLARRHKPNVVWTCSAQNQHMKSQRSVKVKGRECRVTLDGKRLKQLRRYPGNWRCILRLGKTEVGEARAQVV